MSGKRLVRGRKGESSMRTKWGNKRRAVIRRGGEYRPGD
jgi:hypothetical protein